MRSSRGSRSVRAALRLVVGSSRSGSWCVRAAHRTCDECQTFGNNGVAIDLGRWNGELRSAQLTQAGNIVVKRTADTIRPLSRADCAIVAQALEGCAASRDCRSFAKSAQRIPAGQWSQLTRIYHESTGLDVAIFRNLCVRSCELGLTPSFGLMGHDACSGARPRQCGADDPAAGLRR